MHVNILIVKSRDQPCKDTILFDNIIMSDDKLLKCGGYTCTVYVAINNLYIVCNVVNNNQV